MAGIFSIDIQCLTCSTKEIEIIDREDKEASWEWTWECPHCQQEMKRVFSAPVILKATYLDGQRKKDGGYRDLLEASRLESDMMNLPPSQRAGHARQIQQLKRLK